MNEYKNKVDLMGTIAKVEKAEHFPEHFIRIEVAAIRLKSEAVDLIPVVINTKEYPEKWAIGDTVSLYGKFYSKRFSSEDGEMHTLLYVVPETIICHMTKEENTFDYQSTENVIEIEGNICKKPLFRTTPRGKKITDLMIAINMEHGTTVYIPCICWENVAIDAANAQIGDRVYLKGRIQSRVYEKDGMERTVYEVSAFSFLNLGENNRLEKVS